MGGLFGGGEETTTQTTKVDLPKYVEGPLKGLIRDATSLSQQEYSPYGGQRLAGFSQDELNAMDLVRAQMGQTGAGIGAGRDITSEVARRGLEGFTTDELQPYMNPYLENVLEAGKRSQFETFDKQLADYRGRAGEAAAFGGSRFGLGEAQMISDFEQNIADYENQARAQAYQSALGQAQSGTRLAGQAGQQLGSLAQQQQQAGLTDISSLATIGEQQRQQQQLGLDVGYQDYLTKQAYPYEQQQYLASLLYPAAGLTAGQTTTSVQEQDSSPLSSILGIASLAAAPFTGGASLMGTMGSGLGSLAGMAGMGAGTASSLGGGLGSLLGSNFGGGFISGATGFQDGGVVTPSRKPAESPFDQTTQNILDTIAKVESRGDYNITAGEEHEMPITEMSINDIQEWQNKTRTKAKNRPAVGKYQFMPDTLDTIKKGMGLTGDEVFDEEMQEKAGRYLLHNRGYGDYLAGNISKEKLARNLSKEWASLPKDESGVSYYAGKGGNKAHIDWGTVLSSLELPNKNAFKCGGKVKGYRDGGTISNFVQDVTNSPLARGAMGLSNAYSTGWENLLLSEMRDAENIGKTLDYFTQPTDAPSKTTTMLEQLRKEAELGFAGNRLGRGQTPVRQQNLENQVQRMSRDPNIGDAYMTPSGGLQGLPAPRTQTPQRQATPTEDVIAAYLGSIKDRTGVTPTPKDTAPKKEEKKDEEVGGINYPLVAFGASLLQSKGDFLPALGKGVETAVKTKMGMAKTKEDRIREQAEMALQERKADIYGRQVDAQTMAAQNPYTKLIQAAKLRKLEQDLSSDKELQKRVDSFAKEFIADGRYTPAQAKQMALEMVGAEQISSNTSPKRMSLADFINQQ